MTLKLAAHINTPSLLDEAERQLGKWLGEYSASYDGNNNHQPPRRLAQDMIEQASTMIHIKDEEIYLAVKNAFLKGWSVGQGDMREDANVAWETSDLKKSMDMDMAERRL